MSVDKHPSRMPSPPRKPPAAMPSMGESGQAGVPYGSRHSMQVKNPNKSEMAHHFTGSDGRAKSAGREESQEGPKGRAGKVGDENSSDEPG
jgi:hypothetical protein